VFRRTSSTPWAILNLLPIREMPMDSTEGVAKNEVEAAKYKLAADQGHAGPLSLMSGQGVSTNLAEAAKYFRLAAGQGIAAAQWGFGHALDHAEGVSKNVTEAGKYYKLAADQGSALGQCSYLEKR
jgi:TPR repeat protein